MIRGHSHRIIDDFEAHALNRCLQRCHRIFIETKRERLAKKCDELALPLLSRLDNLMSILGIIANSIQ